MWMIDQDADRDVKASSSGEAYEGYSSSQAPPFPHPHP